MRDLSADQLLWLKRAQEIGFIGPKPVELVYEHALGFATCIDELLRTGLLPSSFFLADLGSGAGVPGLFLAQWFPEGEFVLIDSMRKRYRFLEEMAAFFGLQERVAVYGGRSEDVAQLSQFRMAFDLVTARGFASPSATVENASGLLKRDGVLLVSDPPDVSVERWPEAGLRLLGFSSPNNRKVQFSYCWMVKNLEVRGRFPRGVGIPEKLPLF